MRGGPEEGVHRGSLQQAYRRGREDAEAAEGAGLVAGDTSLEALRTGRAGGAKVDLLLGRDGHVEEELRARGNDTGQYEERVCMERAVFAGCGKYEGCGKHARK